MTTYRLLGLSTQKRERGLNLDAITSKKGIILKEAMHMSVPLLSLDEIIWISVGTRGIEIHNFLAYHSKRKRGN